MNRARVRAVFLEASSLPPGGRDAFLAEACGGDEALREEVESLLRHHEEGTVIEARPRVRSRRAPGVALGVACALCVVVTVAHALADRRQHRRLAAVLAAGVTEARAALERRLGAPAERLRALAASPEVAAALERLGRGGDVAAAGASITPLLPRGNLGYAFLNEDAEVLLAAPAGAPPERGAALTPIGRELFERMQRSRGATPVLAFPRGALVEGGGAPGEDAHVVALGAPVGRGWCVVVVDEGALPGPVAAPAGDDLPLASYVIDAAGLSLTESPRRGVRPLVPVRRPDGRPTRAVAAACRGADGLDVGGYPDARGVEVAGAWRWLPAWSVGVVTEVDLAAARAPLRGLRRARSAALLAAAAALVALVVARARSSSGADFTAR